MKFRKMSVPFAPQPGISGIFWSNGKRPGSLLARPRGRLDERPWERCCSVVCFVNTYPLDSDFVFLFFFISREPTTCPAKNCLKTIVCLCAIPSLCFAANIFCLCVILTELLSENDVLAGNMGNIIRMAWPQTPPPPPPP